MEVSKDQGGWEEAEQRPNAKADEDKKVNPFNKMTFCFVFLT